MSTGDRTETCPFCNESYYVINGHNCTKKEEYTPTYILSRQAPTERKLDKIIELLEKIVMLLSV